MNENDRIDALIARFGSYQPQDVTLHRLQLWLSQFEQADYDLALRIFETVEFYDLVRLHKLLKTLHKEIRTKTSEAGFRKVENLVFCAIGKTGESGHEIVRRYRDVNGIIRKQGLLAEVIELPQILYQAKKEGRKLAVVFLDDFIGTGKTVADYWNKILSQFIFPTEPLYLGAAVGYHPGVERVRNETPFDVTAVHYVQNNQLLDVSANFTAAEKYRIREYCDRVGNPALGIGNLGVMIAFGHGVPNNALAILRGSKKQQHFRGILPRFDDLPQH